MLSHSSYANEKAPRIQKRFEEYFEVQYPLPKQDSAVSFAYNHKTLLRF